MLSLHLKSGEYLTIGESIAVQVFQQSGGSIRVAVQAPREVPILRGEILEKTGQKPEGLLKKRPKSPSDQKRDAKQLQKMAERKAERAAITKELEEIINQAVQLSNEESRKKLEVLKLRLNSLTQTQ